MSEFGVPQGTLNTFLQLEFLLVFSILVSEKYNILLDESSILLDMTSILQTTRLPLSYRTGLVS